MVKKKLRTSNSVKVKVSAMMLTHNRKNWLKEAIKSILNQTYKDFELIIIDNASTDGTKEMVEKEFNDERIVYVRNETNLCSPARKQMVDLAKGEYIVICDDDDISMSDRFEKCVKFLEANHDVAIVYGDLRQIKQTLDSESEYEMKYSIEPTFKNIYESDGVINSPTVMMRKKIIEEVGGYDKSFLIAEDYDLYLRVANKYKIAHLDCFLTKYRIHDNNLSLKNVGLTAKYRQKALLRWAKVSCLCFSCNRVFQLDNYIRSFFRFVNFLKINKKGLLSFPNGGVQLSVLYKSDKYKKGYEELKEKYPRVNFIEEHDFEEQVLNWLKNAPNFVMFGTDDTIFKDYVDMNKVVEKLKLKDTIGFSLRLGKGLNFDLDMEMKEPDYEEENGILRWDWRNEEHHYGYPFELDATVYKKEFVEFVINSLRNWGHPNLLEGLGDRFVKQFGENCGKYLYAFSESKALIIQINRVQNIYPNHFFDTGYDVKTLFQLWKQGKKLDLDYYKKKFNSIIIKDFVLEGELKEKVSVIIPIYNQKKLYFDQCIKSVLDQTIKPHEIIIVDDGSDPPQNIVLSDAKKIPIKLLRNKKNLGIGASRRRGVDEATGDYISFLSSDDIWDKDFLKTMLKTAKQHPRKILYSKFFRIDGESKIIKELSFPSYEEKEDFCIACWNSAYKDKMFVNFSTLFIPKEVFEKVKFDENLRFGEDLDFLLRSMKHFEYYLVNQPIVHYRAVDNLTSRIFDKIPENNKKIREKCREYWNLDEVQNILKWWDECHKKGKIKWLSDYSGKYIWDFHKINRLIVKGNKVLNIGVGTGRGTKDLWNKGMQVYALDISKIALDNVKPNTIERYLPAQLKELPKNFFDLVISHLVAQHMSDEDLLEQMKAVIKSLKSGGIFSMQLADSDGEYKQDIKIQMYGGVCRSKSEIKKLVEKANGKIIWISKYRYWPKDKSSWYAIHIKRKMFGVLEK